MEDETITIKGTEYRKGDPVVIRHKLLTLEENKLVSLGEYDSIGYLRNSEINEHQIKFIYLARDKPDDTDKFTWTDCTRNDKEIREKDIVSIVRLLTEKR